MRRTLSTLIAVALLCGLGLMAALASPLGGKILAGPSAVSAAQPAAPLAEPDAPLAGEKFNMIALPLDSQDQFTAGGFGWNAAGLAGFAGTGVMQVLRWNATTQTYELYVPGDPFSTNFSLQVGGTYWLSLSSTASNLISFVGDVPPQSGQPGAVQFAFTAGTGGGCKFNQFSLPLDKGSLIKASQVAGAIGGVTQLLQWNATNQTFVLYDGSPFAVDFDTRIGYPYLACLGAGAPATWP